MRPIRPQCTKSVYRHLLQHRHAQVLPIDEPLQPTASVYDHSEPLPVLQATSAQAEAVLASLEASMTPRQAIAPLETWYEV